MKKEIRHINFDGRNIYEGVSNIKKLTTEFFEKDYSLPLWGTEQQFKTGGLKIKENEKPVKIQFVIGEERGIGEVRYYTLYNFSQTEKSILQTEVSSSQIEEESGISSEPVWVNPTA